MTDLSARTLCAMADAEISARAGRWTPSTCTRVLRAGDDERGRGHRRVRQRDMELVGAAQRRPVRRPHRAAAPTARRSALASPRSTSTGTEPAPTLEGLHDRLLGGEARGQSLGLAPGVALLAFGEEPIDDSRPTSEDDLEARDVDDVDADADVATTRPSRSWRDCAVGRRFDRVRAPRRRRTVCRAMTSTIGVNIGSVAGTRSTKSATDSICSSSSVATATTLAPRAFTSERFESIFSCIAGSVAMAITTTPGSIKASGPCFSSPPG